MVTNSGGVAMPDELPVDMIPYIQNNSGTPSVRLLEDSLPMMNYWLFISTSWVFALVGGWCCSLCEQTAPLIIRRLG